MKPPYLDASLSVEKRVEDLLSRMTLDEKLAQLGCVWSTELLHEGRFQEQAAREKLAHGIGQVTRIGGATVLSPRESALFANEIQRFLIEQTRLQVPAIIHEESCAGYLARDATCFPQAIGLAATFDPALVGEIAREILVQMRSVGARQTLAPVLDVARDPRWGRTEETFGEDPYLVSQMGIAYVGALQGERLCEGILCTGKHFVGYAASEGGMNWAPAHLGARELREVYASPFEAVIGEAGLASIMNGYHELDGVPCGASRALLTDLLRGELGFEGIVVADYFTVDCLREYHRVAGDKAEAAICALQAGIDVELPQRDCYGAPLREALENGRAPMTLVDQAARRLLRVKFQLGLFERPCVDPGAASSVFDTPAQRALARRAAAKSIILLKNERKLLPLSKNLRSIAVLGPSADRIRLLQGDYHYPTHLEIMFGRIESEAPRPASAEPKSKSGTDLGAHFPPMVSILEGVRRAVSPQTEVLSASGCDVLSSSTDGFAQAVSLSERAEVTVVVVGGRSGLVDGCTSGESIDRAELGLPGVQQAFVEAVVRTGRPVVVVLVDGRPLTVPWIAEHAGALVHAWLPGEEGGSAVADVLFGDVNPAGRLPISMPRGVGQVPVYYAHKPSGGRSHWRGNYLDSPATPLFSFGYGLSYTHFEYGSLEIEPARVQTGEVVAIGAKVTNAGVRAGEEVVQLYVHDPIASVTRPVKELRGFARLALNPGESKRVRFELAMEQLAFRGLDEGWIVEPGIIEVMVGGASDDAKLVGSFEITGPALRLERRRRFTTQVRVESGA
ncbi:MAG TPA: glycoside hydrolase family 3 N-terminal domain-containing protein [Myxococcota bacterium]|nr:glycoside hydrolase family 3 N-terminal domain-containing protein [Myxococcota bacterium]